MAHPRLCWQDVAYASIGAFLSWQSSPQDLWAAAWIWFLGLLAYCAGRAVGAVGNRESDHGAP